MNRKHFELLEALQYADDTFVETAGQPWNGKKKRILESAGVRAACMLLVAAAGLGGIFHEQVAAAISSFTTQIAQWLGNENDLRPYTEVINEKQTENGVTMTLREVLIDASSINAAIDVSWEDGVVTGRPWMYYGAIYVNGEYVDTLMLRSYEMEAEGQYVLSAPYQEGAVPQEIENAELMIRFVQTQEDNTIDGIADFNFAFETSGENIREQIRVLPVDRTLKTEDGLVFHVQDIAYTEASARVHVQMEGEPRTFYGEGEERYSEIHYRLDMTDDKGNRMLFEAVDYDEETGALVLDCAYGTPTVDTAEYLDIELVEYSTVPVSAIGEEPSGEEIAEQFPDGLSKILDETRLPLKTE